MPALLISEVVNRQRYVHRADFETTIAIGSSATCGVVLRDLEPIQAWIQIDDHRAALYVMPSVEVQIADEGQPLQVSEGGPIRYALAGPRVTFQLGRYTIEVVDLPHRPKAHAHEPADPVEADLLAALRANLPDDAVRAVYADWLELHGWGLRAKLLRADTEAARTGQRAVRLDLLAPADDDAWRAVISRAPIERCGATTAGVRCPGTWSALALTEDDRARHCGACARLVFYCASLDDASDHGHAGNPVALDAALDRGEALAMYERLRWVRRREDRPDNVDG